VFSEKVGQNDAGLVKYAGIGIGLFACEKGYYNTDEF